jgi:hypothetical protein
MRGLGEKIVGGLGGLQQASHLLYDKRIRGVLRAEQLLTLPGWQIKQLIQQRIHARELFRGQAPGQHV